MNKRLVGMLCLAMCSTVACGDDSSGTSKPDKPGSQCSEGQVLAKNGICYDNPSCESCLSTEVCVGGKCYDEDSPCGKCAPDLVCNNDVCYSADDPCASCGADEVCVEDKCVEKTDAVCSPACGSDEYCDNGSCKSCAMPCGDECCLENQVCGANGCEAKQEQICEQGQTPCGNHCCQEGEVCNQDILECGRASDCDESRVCGDECCEDGYLCEEGECRINCEGADRCGANQDFCCDVTEVCEENKCKVRCDGGTRCGMLEELCCVGETPDCLNNVCVAACPGSRCGKNSELCCDAETEVCMFDKCIEHGRECTKSNMCKFDEICEDTVNYCINEDYFESSCQVFPEFTEFKALEQWHWPNVLPGGVPSTEPDYIQVIVTPLAANLTDDDDDGVIDENDVPDVVFIAYSKNIGPDAQAPSVIRVISGNDGHEIASSGRRYWTYPTVLALGDVDADGKTEIAAVTNNHRIYYSTDYSTGDPNDYYEILSVEPDVTSPTGYKLVTKYQLRMGNNQRGIYPSLADLDGDGYSEFISDTGVATIKPNDAGELELRWVEGCEDKNLSSYPHAADLDGDGQMELVTASGIYDNHCNQLVSGDVGGHIAIADLMPSGEDAAETGELIPEIAHVNNGCGDGLFSFTKVYKKDNGDGTFTWSLKPKVWTAPIPVDRKRSVWNTASADCENWTKNGCKGDSTGHHYCYSGGGTPVIADFNGDKKPDVGVAARYYYIVYSNDGTPTGGKVLWADGHTQDYSSAATGSSVFDFEGDGKAEVIYGDETKLHIYSGLGAGEDKDGDGYPDPVEIFTTPNYSATGAEYPIVVDVDNDGSTEIVIASDRAAYPETVGVRAFEDPGGQWVRTRRIWNQHFYHVTNINEDGSVPVKEDINWLHPKLNNYRQNVQPGGVYNAPNLVAVGLEEDKEQCVPDKEIVLSAKIENQGSLGVKAGLSVKFYVVDPNGQKGDFLIDEKNIPQTMAPGKSYTLTYHWNLKVKIGEEEVTVNRPATIYYIIDEPTKGKVFGEFVECIETDNKSANTVIEGCETVA